MALSLVASKRLAPYLYTATLFPRRLFKDNHRRRGSRRVSLFYIYTLAYVKQIQTLWVDNKFLEQGETSAKKIFFLEYTESANCEFFCVFIL